VIGDGKWVGGVICGVGFLRMGDVICDNCGMILEEYVLVMEEVKENDI
jgi:hypothetical protein